MSTRGAVAVGTLRNWRGVYNHFDSYPTGLGKELYEHLMQRMFEDKTLAEIGSDILCFDDWRNYLKGGVCEYCGKMTGQAHNISSTILGKHRRRYPDPQAKHHEHQSFENVEQIQFTPKDLKDSGLEWVYILDPAAECIRVLSLRERRKHVGDLRFDIAPDFGKIECGDELERCHHYAWSHFPEIAQDGPQGRLGTQHYLGLKPLRRLDDAYAFELRGKRYRRTGSGVHGAYAHRVGSFVNSPDTRAWYESVRGEDGRSFYLAVGRIGKRDYTPYAGVTWIFPPTRANPVETIRNR